MRNWGGWLAAILFIVLLNVGANIIAQKVYPTLTRDGTGRRIAYRVVFVGSLFALLAACVLVLLAFEAAGYRM
ncbi:MULTISPECIES: hypothetical protein [unclassified Mesorhizobium]|uniref:hypothetical protein n=1 Tax=unclassified Mesorhizobium TaxID=325217 RepID=UPI00333BF843